MPCLNKYPERLLLHPTVAGDIGPALFREASGGVCPDGPFSLRSPKNPSEFPAPTSLMDRNIIAKNATIIDDNGKNRFKRFLIKVIILKHTFSDIYW